MRSPFLAKHNNYQLSRIW